MRSAILMALCLAASAASAQNLRRGGATLPEANAVGLVGGGVVLPSGIVSGRSDLIEVPNYRGVAVLTFEISLSSPSNRAVTPDAETCRKMIALLQRNAKSLLADLFLKTDPKLFRPANVPASAVNFVGFANAYSTQTIAGGASSPSACTRSTYTNASTPFKLMAYLAFQA